MPVLVSGKEPVWHNQFGGLEVNHNNRVFHEGAGCSGLSGGVAVAGGVERDFGTQGRSSAFTRRQEMEEVRETERKRKRERERERERDLLYDDIWCAMYTESHNRSKPHP